MLCILNKKIRKQLVLLVFVISSFVLGSSKALGVFNLDEKTNLKNSQIEAIKAQMLKYSDQIDFIEDSLNPEPRLIVFLSKSMPESLIVDYIKEGRKYGARFVFRGVEFDKKLGKILFRPYYRLYEDLSELVGDDEFGFDIDPFPFSDFGVDKVPAIVLAKPVTIMDINANGMLPVGDFDKVTGAVTVQYALKLFAENGSMSNEALSLLNKEEGE